MKVKHFVGGLVVVFAVVFSSCNKNNGCSRSEKAIALDLSTESDSCGTVFQLEDGTLLEATNANQFQAFENGDLVWLSYKETSGASLCNMGEIVRLRCLVPREF